MRKIKKGFIIKINLKEIMLKKRALLRTKEIINKNFKVNNNIKDNIQTSTKKIILRNTKHNMSKKLNKKKIKSL